MPHLVIPIQVDALFLAEGITCIGQDINFDQLPYFDLQAKVDVNGDRPYAAEAIIAPPFQNDNLRLRRGVHLHWALPALLTTSKHGGDSSEFPAVPNRWYIRKEEKGEVLSEWVVESDYLWSNEPDCPVPELCVTALPVAEGKPYTYMGRRYTLEEWKKHKSDPENYWYHTYQEPLTSLGWGTLAFDTFYPNCRSVFGLHDKDVARIIEEDKLTYTVIGWTENLHGQKGQKDYVQELIEKFKKGKIDGTTLSDILNIELPEAPETLSDGLLCYGSIQIARYISNNPDTSGINLSVGNTYSEAMSSMLSHVHAEDGSPLGLKIAEEQLETVMLEDEMTDLKLDVRARLRELRHEKGFNGLETGCQWTVGPLKKKQSESMAAPDKQSTHKHQKAIEKLKDKQQKEQDKLEEAQQKELGALDDSQEGFDEQKTNLMDKHRIAALELERKHKKELEKLLDQQKEELGTLKTELYRELDKLKQAQWRYNLLSNELESQMSALYHDWARYIFCSYPPEGETEEFPNQDHAMNFIRAQSIPNVTNLRERLGAYPLGDVSNPKRVPEANTLEYEIVSSFRRLSQVVEAVNKLDDPKNALEVNRTAGTVYWEPSVPSIVLATPQKNEQGTGVLTPSGRFGTPDKANGAQGGAYMVTEKKIELGRSNNFEADKLLAEVNRFRAQITDEVNQLRKWETFGQNSLPANAWHSYKVDWEVEVFPLASGNAATKRSSNYSTKFIQQNYELTEGNSDLTKNSEIGSAHALLKSSNVYQGSGYMSPKVAKEYQNKLTTYKVNLGDDSPFKTLFDNAIKTLGNSDVLAFSLGGFNQILLQQSILPTLKPKDPLGFESYIQFADEVNKALGSKESSSTNFNFSPNPLSAYIPIRSGAMNVLRVRLIDSFGRVTDVKPKASYTSAYNTVNGQPGWVMLQPRLAQPANMSIRWKDQVKTIDGSPSPNRIVCGWMIPNILDQNLMFFDAKGRHIGNINPRGEWERDVFWLNKKDSDAGKSAHEAQGKVSSSKVINQVVAWLQSKQSSDGSFMTEFIRYTSRATENILPEDKDTGSVVSVLAGRPMAIVQANVNLYLRGNPAFDLSWNEFRQDMERGARETDNFTKVKFPFRLGDFRQANDNLIGYWKNDYTGELAETFWLNDTALATLNQEKASQGVPSSLEFEKSLRLDSKAKSLSLKEFLSKLVDNGFIAKQALMDAYFENGGSIWNALVKEQWIIPSSMTSGVEYAANDKLAFSVEDAPQLFTMLLNPTGVTHLLSGIVPVQEISLPNTLYQEALKNIEITFFTAPVLKTQTGLTMSLPSERNYTWSWLQARRTPEGFEFHRTLHKPNIRKSTFEATLQEQLLKRLNRGPIELLTKSSKSITNIIEVQWRALGINKWITRETKYEEEFGVVNYKELEKTTKEFEERKNEILEAGLADPQSAITELENDPKFQLFFAFLSLFPQIVEGIRPFSDRPQEVSATKIVEGWLSLKSS